MEMSALTGVFTIKQSRLESFNTAAIKLTLSEKVEVRTLLQ